MAKSNSASGRNGGAFDRAAGLRIAALETIASKDERFRRLDGVSIDRLSTPELHALYDVHSLRLDAENQYRDGDEFPAPPRMVAIENALRARGKLANLTPAERQQTRNIVALLR